MYLLEKPPLKGQVLFVEGNTISGTLNFNNLYLKVEIKELS